VTEGKIAVHTEDTEARGISVFSQPGVQGRSTTTVTYFLTISFAVARHVIYRKEFFVRVAAACTTVAAVSRVGGVFESQVRLSRSFTCTD
jgi:hypothetical protein